VTPNDEQETAGPMKMGTYEATSRAAWREWLEKHHATSSGVRLVIYKKASGKQRLSYDEAVEEALCFGWVDSTTNTLDANRYTLNFSPRKPGSVWAQSNKQRVERLIEQGLMTPAGLAKIEAAKRDGAWSKMDAIDDLVMPDDLAAALAANPDANQHFAAFSNSAKKMILFWISSARRPETRQKRVEQTVAAAAKNIKAAP
jgi:uncharacterized protein YdeI (YjbR/CyaY-like superfamily)